MEDSKRIEAELWNQVKNKLDMDNREFNLGKYHLSGIKQDIKHFGFILSRYKFVAKMLKNVDKLSVLELGCNEGIGAMFMAQNCDLKKYVGVDLDEDAIAWSKKYVEKHDLYDGGGYGFI